MKRYERQTALPEIGEAGQQRLARARVLVVGVGGLGSPLALYLAAAGVGTIGLVDDDCVALSNLQRQVLYDEAHLGCRKAEAAAGRLRALNGSICVEPYPFRLTADNARPLLERYDVVADGCDNAETRYLLSDLCETLGKPYVYAAIQGFEGQVAVFDTTRSPATYRSLYPQAPAPSAAQRAVVGVTPAVVGSVEASEVLKLICGYGEPLYGRLWTIDLRTLSSFIVEL